jgi:thiamine thiazole synthase
MEKFITKAMLDKFYKDLSEAVSADVFVIGAGPSGLVCARELAKSGLKVFVIEQNNYLGGGFWIGGYYMNSITIREPANELFDELGIPYEKVQDGLYISY